MPGPLGLYEVTESGPRVTRNVTPLIPWKGKILDRCDMDTPLFGCGSRPSQIVLVEVLPALHVEHAFHTRNGTPDLLEM